MTTHEILKATVENLELLKYPVFTHITRIMSNAVPQEG